MFCSKKPTWESILSAISCQNEQQRFEKKVEDAEQESPSESKGLLWISCSAHIHPQSQWKEATRRYLNNVFAYSTLTRSSGSAVNMKEVKTLHPLLKAH